MLSRQTLLGLSNVLSERHEYWLFQLGNHENQSRGYVACNKKLDELNGLRNDVAYEIQALSGQTLASPQELTLKETYDQEGKLAAIKMYKNASGDTLRGSKDFIEKYAADNGWKLPERR